MTYFSRFSEFCSFGVQNSDLKGKMSNFTFQRPRKRCRFVLMFTSILDAISIKQLSLCCCFEGRCFARPVSDLCRQYVSKKICPLWEGQRFTPIDKKLN